MNKSTKQTLLSSWIRKSVPDGKNQADPAPTEKRKREEPEPEEEKRAESVDDEAAAVDASADDGRRRAVDLEERNAAPPPPAASSPSEPEPALDEEEENEHGVDDHGLTAYEREREALIARNREALAALGVASAARALLCRESAAGVAQRRRRTASSKRRAAGASASSAAAFPEEIAARRSSLRPRRGGVAAAGGAAAAGAAAAATEAAAAPPRQRTPTPEPETYDNRIVLCYIVSARTCSSPALPPPLPTSSSPSAAPPSALRRLPLVLAGPVVRAYSVSASRCGSLLAAGGKDGWACIWGLRGLSSDENRRRRRRGEDDEDEDEDEDEEEEEEPERAPLLSARLHRSWIADVALVSTSKSNDDGGCAAAAAAPLLLTAANDGTLAVHDTGAAAEQERSGGIKEGAAASAENNAPAGAPRRLASATPHGGAGIFSMDVDRFSSTAGSHFDVATASKDGSLVVSRVVEGGGNVKEIASIEDAHAGAVAKCVRWRDGTTLASCGNDGAARLWDARCPYGGGGGGGAAVEIAGATVGGVAANVVRWLRGPESGSSEASSHPNHLLVSGTNPEALVFDVRRPREPLFSLKPPPPSSSAAAGRSSSSSVIFQPAVVARGRAVAVGLPRSRVISLFDARDGAPLSRGDVGAHDASTLASFETSEGEEVVAAVGTRCLRLFSPEF